MATFRFKYSDEKPLEKTPLQPPTKGSYYILPGTVTLKARFPMDVWVCGCIREDLLDDLSK